MTKTIRKPLVCRNAHCGAMCSMIMAEDCMRIFKEPRKCPNYERDDIGYEHEVINKIRAEIAEYGSIMVTYAITDDTKTDKGIEKLVSDVLQQAKEEVLQIIDKHKAESED